MTTRIIGNYLSPYVRKVLVCMDIKGVPYQIDPIVPFFGNQDFSAVSPVRRIPVLIDADITLPDSTPIVEYLEDRYPETPLYPRDPVQRAKARWLEEYADTRMGDAFVWKVFNNLAIKPFVWREETDQTVVQQAMTDDIPEIVTYLENIAPPVDASYIFGDSISIADISIASFFRNIQLVRQKIDFSAAPRTEALVNRVLSHPSFVKLQPFEIVCMKKPVPEHRAALGEAGAPLTEASLLGPKPRRGIMHSPGAKL